MFPLTPTDAATNFGWQRALFILKNSYKTWKKHNQPDLSFDQSRQFRQGCRPSWADELDQPIDGLAAKNRQYFGLAGKVAIDSRTAYACCGADLCDRNRLESVLCDQVTCGVEQQLAARQGIFSSCRTSRQLRHYNVIHQSQNIFNADLGLYDSRRFALTQPHPE
jgi:hypothetical protein